ncbi:MAG: hypothetical protein JSS11_15020 [Verrucomicrobia bacterium]|nr:hypothetical protein [Verrucomicrobiota bacterium]
MSEESIRLLEAQVPTLSGVAFAEARQLVLESGQSVLQSENGVIYKIFPDGAKVRIKEVEPQSVVSGSRFPIQ